MEGEFDAMGVPFYDRGARTDDIINILRACWSEDPISYRPNTVTAVLDGIRTLPAPGRQIPIWIGGNSNPALRRAKTLGDGWHGTRVPPEQTALAAIGEPLLDVDVGDEHHAHQKF